MKYLFIVLLISPLVNIKAQDTLYIRGEDPLIVRVTEVNDEGFVLFQKLVNNNVVAEKIKINDIKAIRYKNGYEDKFNIDKSFYNDTVQLINSKKIICAVREHNDDFNVMVDTYDSYGLISISFDTVSCIFYHTGKFELVHELINSDNDNINIANKELIDTTQAFKFADKLNLDDSTLDEAKNDIEKIKALFDQYVKNEAYKKDENYKGEKADFLITELIFDYCTQFNEDYFTGTKAGDSPMGKGKLYKVRGQGEVREIQIGEFLNGRLNGEGKIIKNSITEKEGTFKEGELNGKGTIIDLEGRRKKTGTFVDNQLTGKGEVHFNTGAYEQGEYLGSFLTGKGERYLQNGNFYKGTFKEGRYSGWGIYHWAELNIDYEGDFDSGKRNGNGILKLPNGIVISGTWKNDCPDGIMDIQMQAENADDKYTGYWIIKNCTVESKKNTKGKIKLEEDFLLLKTISFF